jgi:hypothetical protein
VVASVDDEFKLPESDHLGVYIAQHSTNGRPTLDPRTGRIADLREQLSPPRQSTLDTPPLYLASMTGESKPPPTPHDNVEPAASEHGDGDGGRARHNPDDIALPPGRIDEAVCAVVDVIERETGGRVYPGSQPHDELREAVTIAGQGFAALADDLAENIHGLRSPSVAAGRALALAPGAAAAQHDKRRAKEAGDRARLTQLARIVDMGGVENLTDDELREFRELGARVTSLGGDED